MRRHHPPAWTVRKKTRRGSGGTPEEAEGSPQEERPRVDPGVDVFERQGGVEEHLSRTILETIGEVGAFDAAPGAGIAVQLNIEDAVGVTTQVESLADTLGDDL